MEGDRIEMSQRERDRLKVMVAVLEGRRTQPEAARLLRRCVRQVRRIQRRLEAEGDGGVIHRLRGRRSNRAKEAPLRRRVLSRYRERYLGFGPTLAAEKLTAEGLPVSDETLRNWLLAAGLWERQRRRDRHRQRRVRRECFGELTQADGSEHDWLEGRGPRMVLLVASSIITSRTIRGPRPSSQSCSLPSACTNSPKHSRRSRRQRCLSRLRCRVHSPSANSHRRNVS
jgi:hypothetical protein